MGSLKGRTGHYLVKSERFSLTLEYYKSSGVRLSTILITLRTLYLARIGSPPSRNSTVINLN